MSLDQYLNAENIKKSTIPVDALQLLQEDQDVIQSEIIEIKNFDAPGVDECIELHIYDTNGQYVTSDHEADHWKQFGPSDDSFIQYDIYKNLKDIGIDHGTYKVALNFFRSLVGNENNPNLYIREIAPNRTELLCRIGSDNILAKNKQTEDTVVPDISTTEQLNLMQNQHSALCNPSDNTNFMFLNKGNNNLDQIVNFKWIPDTGELYLKLYKPVPDTTKVKQRFWISLQIRQPYIDNLVLYKKPISSPISNLKGPNFEIDTIYGTITETNYQSWNELLGSNLSTSQQIIDKMFSGSLSGAQLGIDYSGFQNFVHFSSAAERLANFKYKVGILEYYNTQIGLLNSISESNEVNTNKVLYNKYKDSVIGGFDGFEQYLYKEQSGSYYSHGTSGSAIFHETFVVSPYPKVQYCVTSSANGLNPPGTYELHHSTSSIVDTWYNALYSSASLWDMHNENALIKSVPEHIREDSNNSEFELFVNMIGHHYDIMWSYITHQTSIHNREEHYAHGLSKDLLYDTAKSLGWHLVNGNQSERLFEYILGTNEQGDFGNTNERSIDDDLILYVPFDVGRPDFESKNFLDYSPRLNKLEAYDSPAFVEGAHGHGAEFYGNHYLKYNTTYDYGLNDYAVSFWAKDLTWGDGSSRIFSAVSGSGPDAGWDIQLSDAAGVPSIQWNQYYTGSNGSHSISIGQQSSQQVSSSYLDPTSVYGTSTGGKSNGWHHIVFNIARDGNATAYFDNALKNTTDISISGSHDIGPESIGDYPKPIIGAIDTDNSGIPYGGLSGSLDEFRIYKRLLTETEIADLYNKRGIYKTQKTATPTTTPKEHLTHQVWRRIINNLPHLLKTKGTSRSVKALLACYGIPSSLLSIREYGGPKMPNSTPALIEDRFSYALTFNNAAVNSSASAHIRYSTRHYTTNIGTWGFVRPGLNSGDDIPPQTREFRFKPAVTESMLLLTNAPWTNNTEDRRVRFHLAVQYTGSYSGSADYGRLVYSHVNVTNHNYAATGSTPWVPLYDGNFWNVRWYWQATGSGAGIYNRGANLNTTYHIQVQQASDHVVGKIVHRASASYTPTYTTFNIHTDGWGSHTDNTPKGGMFIGGHNGTGANRNSYRVNQNLRRFISGSNAYAGLDTGLLTFSGSMQEYREWLEDIGQDRFDMHTLNPRSYVSSLSPSSSYDTLVRHYPLGTNQVSFDHSLAKNYVISSSHPAQTVLDAQLPYNSGSADELIDSGSSYASMSNWLTPTDTVNNDHYERVDETYYIHGPSIGGKNLKSEKIRIEDNFLVHPLSRETRGEVSQFDVSSNDSNRLGIFFSPQDMINKDMFNQIGDVALDDYFGSPEYQYTDSYPRYKKFAYDYWKKYENDNDINAFIRIFALFDFSFFTQLKQLIPARANADTGLVIEPSVLERSKVILEGPPIVEHIPLEDFIPDPFPDPEMYPIPLDAVIDPPEPMEADTLPLDAVIDPPEPMEADTLPLNAVIDPPEPMEADTLPLDTEIEVSKPIESDILPLDTEIVVSKPIEASYIFHSSSIQLRTDLLADTEQIVVRSIGQDPKEPSHADPGIDIFKIRKGYPGAVYQNISIFHSGSSWHTQSLHPMIVAPTGSVIMEQRKSNIYSKKIFSYAPHDKATRTYLLNRLADGNIIDSGRRQFNAISFGRRAAGSDTINSWTNKTFETVQHNYFTGSIMEFTCSAALSTNERGGNFVEVPRFGPASTAGVTNLHPWSISFLLKEAAGATGKLAFFIGNNTSKPVIGINSSNKITVRDKNEDYWTASTATSNREVVNHYAITYEASSSADGKVSGSMQFWNNGKYMGKAAKEISTDRSFYFDRFGQGYQSTNTTHALSGSLGCVKFYRHKLSNNEIRYLNEYPHLRANRSKEDFASSDEHARRVIASNGFAPFTHVGEFATSHSLAVADYRDDPIDSCYYEGSKLTATAINEPSLKDVEGDPIIKITLRNRYNLVYKKNLAEGYNIAIR